MRSVYPALLLCLCLSACTIGVVNRNDLTPGPSPLLTPKPTMILAPLSMSTPMPIATPKPMPTVMLTPTPPPSPTPSPTPTAIPIPPFPSEAISVSRPLPALPANLYFTRAGNLWRWPADGGDFDLIVTAPEKAGGDYRKLSSPVRGDPPFGVAQYRLTPDGRHLAFLFHDSFRQPYSKLVVRDLHANTSITLPMTIDLYPERFLFDITTDGRYIVYYAQNRLPNTGGKTPGLTRKLELPQSQKFEYGTFMAIDVQNPNLDLELGYCAVRTEGDFRIECSGFALSPDGERLAFSDGRGVWLADIPKGPARLLADSTHGAVGMSCIAWRVKNWSPDGRWLMIEIGCYEGSYAAVMDALTGKIQSVPKTAYYGGFGGGYEWSQNGNYVLSSFYDPSPSYYSGAGVHLYRTPAGDTLEATAILSETWPASVWPEHLHDLPGGRIGFANRRCLDTPGLRSGIYAIEPDGSGLSLLSPLPAVAYNPGGVLTELDRGKVLWTRDGSAFLYFERERGELYEQTNLLLGLTNGAPPWDVRGVLEGASDLQWADF